jgi:hypothetical protein
MHRKRSQGLVGFPLRDFSRWLEKMANMGESSGIFLQSVSCDVSVLLSYSGAQRQNAARENESDDAKETKLSQSVAHSLVTV